MFIFDQKSFQHWPALNIELRIISLFRSLSLDKLRQNKGLADKYEMNISFHENKIHSAVDSIQSYYS